MRLAVEGVCVLPAGEKCVDERVLCVDGSSGENGACDGGESGDGWRVCGGADLGGDQERVAIDEEGEKPVVEREKRAVVKGNRLRDGGEERGDAVASGGVGDGGEKEVVLEKRDAKGRRGLDEGGEESGHEGGFEGGAADGKGAAAKGVEEVEGEEGVWRGSEEEERLKRAEGGRNGEGGERGERKGRGRGEQAGVERRLLVREGFEQGREALQAGVVERGLHESESVLRPLGVAVGTALRVNKQRNGDSVQNRNQSAPDGQKRGRESDRGGKASGEGDEQHGEELEESGRGEGLERRVQLRGNFLAAKEKAGGKAGKNGLAGCFGWKRSILRGEDAESVLPNNGEQNDGIADYGVDVHQLGNGDV